MTMNTFGLGKAIYIGTMSHQHFYHDLVVWLRQMCGLQPLLKVPENVEVSMREKEGMRVFFLLNHQNSPVRIQFYKPMHDFLTGNTFSGNYDLPPHGVLVLDEHPEAKTVWRHRLIWSGCLLPVNFTNAIFAALALLEPRARPLAMARRPAVSPAPARRRPVLCARHHPAQTAQRLRRNHRRIAAKLVQSKLCRPDANPVRRRRCQ